jgi:hypothetical protein
MLVETVHSMLTVVCHTKKMRHQAAEYFQAHLGFMVAAAEKSWSVPQAHKLTLYGNRGQMCISSLEDDGRPIKVCCRKPALNHLKLLALRVPVVSVEEKLILN